MKMAGMVFFALGLLLMLAGLGLVANYDAREGFAENIARLRVAWVEGWDDEVEVQRELNREGARIHVDLSAAHFLYGGSACTGLGTLLLLGEVVRRRLKK